MNEKINLQDLSALLAEKMAITKKEAEMFLREYFDVLNEELMRAKLVKIKDLGTFKLLWVEDRASVDVTTGERFLIPAHYKIAFTPDKKLAETVNEPFALFETTEIENESGLGEIELPPDEDASDESDSESEPDLTSDEEVESASEKGSVPEQEESVEAEEKPIPSIENQRFILRTPILNDDDDEEEEEEPEIEKGTVFENKLDFSKELGMKEEQVLLDILPPKLIEEKSPVQEERGVENEKLIPERKPDHSKELKNHCLNCQDHEKYHLYRKKFVRNQKKLKRMSIILGILSILLVAALGYIAIKQFREYLPFTKSSPIVTTIEPVIQKDTVPESSETLNDIVVPIEKTDTTEKVEKTDEVGKTEKVGKTDEVKKTDEVGKTEKMGKTDEVVETSVKKAAPEQPAPPVASPSTANSKQITVLSGQTLRTIALDEYGNKVFWIYIYMENRKIIPNPDMLSVGMRITIPPAGKYGIDCNDPASIQKAKNASQYP